MRSEPLLRALEKIGGVSAMAELLDITPGAVSQWDTVPIQHVLKIEKATGVGRSELRPDIYPKERRRQTA